jgi:hypothetical protein
VEVTAANGSSASGYEILKLEDFGGRIVRLETESPAHGSRPPTGLTMTVGRADLRPGATYTLKLFAVVNITAWENESATYRLWWDDVVALAHFDDVPPQVIAGIALAVGAIAGAVIFLLVRRRRSWKASALRIDDVFLLYNDGRLIKHYTRAARPSFDSETFGAMLTAVGSFVRDTLGKDEGDELTGMEFGGRKIRFVKGRRLTIAAVVAGGDDRGAMDRARRALEAMEREHAAALEAWSGRAEDVTFASSYVEQLLAGAYGK